MKKFFTFKVLLVAVLGLFGLTANATDFTTSVTQEANSTWANEYATFSLAEVATALGTDTATLAKEINENAVANKMFQYYDGTEYTDAYNGDGAMFWIGLDGKLLDYPDGAFFAGLEVAPEYDVIDVFFGQYPGTLDAGGNFDLKFKVLYGDKEVNLNVNYIVTAKRTLDPVPALASELEIVGKAGCSSEQYPRSDYSSSPVSVYVPDLLESLGITKDDASTLLSNVYIKQYSTEYGLLTDTLQSLTSNGGWTREGVYGTDNVEHAGEPCGEVGFCSWGGGDAMYLDTWALNDGCDTLSFNVGQYPASLAANKSLLCTFYLANGAKAYQISYTLNTLEPVYTSITDMTEVGYVDLETSQSPASDYNTKSTVSVNVDEIAAALGCETSGMALRALAEPDKLSNSSTANNGGWWLTSTGYVTAWSTSSGGSVFYVEPVSTSDFSTLTIGQMPNLTAIGDVYTTTLYAISGGNYYKLNIKLNIEKSDEVQEFESVYTQPLTIQALSAGYTWSEGKTISNSKIEEYLGTTDVTLYALNIDSIAKQTGLDYSSSYSMDPSPGFWLSPEGCRTEWSSATNSPWGMTIGSTTDQDGVTFQCMQFDGGSPIGTTYTGQFFLVNTETGKMITVNLTYQVVESLDNFENVGEADVAVPVSDSDLSVTYDLSEIATALGIEDDIVAGEYFRAMMADGSYCSARAIGDGVNFTLNGACEDYASIWFGYEDGAFVSQSNEQITDDWKADATLVFQNDNKRYTIYLHMMSEAQYDVYTGISSVKASSKAGKMYNLSGAQVAKATKGVYVIDGKKYVVK